MAAELPPSAAELPIPPAEMRALVGPTDPDGYDNPTGSAVFPHVGDAGYKAVLDFGCGCGRLARQFIQQDPRPRRYVGVDLHAGMIAWCERNLAPAAPGFAFVHHDVRYSGFNPGEDKPRVLPLPAEDGSMSLVVAVSVFTHILEDDAEHYLQEIARVLRPGGVFTGTFFLFDKAEFPMMQDFQNALYVNPEDPVNAVIYDRAWLRRAAQRAGLVVTRALAPDVRGYHWHVDLTPEGPGVTPVELGAETGAVGVAPPPLLPRAAHRIGVDAAAAQGAPAAAQEAASNDDGDAAAHAREAARQRRLAQGAAREATAQRERAEIGEREARSQQEYAAGLATALAAARGELTAVNARPLARADRLLRRVTRRLRRATPRLRR
jgi:SAM-dependent methyltransferase